MRLLAPLGGVALVLAAVGCAPGSEDADLDTEETARGSEAVALLAGVAVPPAIAQATVVHQMLVTDSTTDLDAVEAVLTEPVETLGGEVVGYLAAVAPAGESGDLLDLAERSAILPGDVRTYVVGARIDRAPVSMTDASGTVLRGLGRTLTTIGGREALARLVAVTSTELLVETTGGALYMAGAEQPLSEFELEQLDQMEAARAELAALLPTAVRDQLAEQWMPFVHRATDRQLEPFVTAEGNLDLAVARRTLAEDRILARPDILREPPPEGADPGDKGTATTRRTETACVSYFLYQCTEWAYDEVGAYADPCITAPNPFLCNANAQVAAVPHKEDKHPIDGFTYAGCGPESFASLVWQRWKNGDRFGFAEGELEDLPNYRSPSNPRTIMHQAAHGANRAMEAFPARDGNIATWPWNYADGANAWLAERGSTDRIVGSWSLLDANALSSAVQARAEVLQQLVGRGFGPVVALGGLGDTLGSPHYAPVYRYRVTRNAEGKARAVYATIDWNKELALSDPWQYATGIYHFEADLARARATK